MKRVVVWCLVVVGLLVPAAVVSGQEGAASPEVPFAFEGPPPPVLPNAMSRDASGHATVRAVPIATPLRIDGLLDESVYTGVVPMSGFTQADPRAGDPATEATEVWVFFDRENVYIAARCWESRPDRLIANELRRDHNNIVQNDNISFGFDTFFDRRSGVVLETTPIGARLDVQFAYEGQNNYDWNPIWQVKVRRFEKGWTVEASIPFKSLRYRAGRQQIWGFNVRRSNRWKNEVSYLNPIPASMGMGGIFRSSLAAPMVGIEAPAGSKSLEIKPYVFANLTTDRAVSPAVSNHPGGDYGLDVKYGVTQNLTADLTYNTDFAQVEADSQQVNLTRFSLFFPEKREFFLENQGTFNFGGGFPWGDVPTLFYSRRIGLSAGRQVPIRGGGRLTGRVGSFTLGALNIQADEEPISKAPSTNFSVMRIKRDLFRKSSVGLILTERTVAQRGVGGSAAYGVDGRFAFFNNLTVNTYWARTSTQGLSGDSASYRAQLDYSGDRYGVQAEQLVVGDNFNPELGFVRRDDMRRTFGQFRFSPRPQSSRIVRKYSASVSAGLVKNGAGRLETREATGSFGVDFQNSDQFDVQYAGHYEFLPQPFAIAPGVVLPVGGYDFGRLIAIYQFGRQRQTSGTASVEHGTFYSGHRTVVGVSGARMNVGPRFSVEPTMSVNRVDLVQGSFSTTLVGSRVTFTMTPMMFASALLQYNSSNHSLSANVRLRWEYRPGSELFVVFNEQRDTLARSFPAQANRAFIVKINRLFRL
ncbi:MAG: hypothetical protein EXQ48_07185 [Acidobacteria bacterium]|nr:hypothetical protein [Acidobacteriota bacterium]